MFCPGGVADIRIEEAFLFQLVSLLITSMGRTESLLVPLVSILTFNLAGKPMGELVLMSLENSAAGKMEVLLFTRPTHHKITYNTKF